MNIGEMYKDIEDVMNNKDKDDLEQCTECGEYLLKSKMVKEFDQEVCVDCANEIAAEYKARFD